MAAKTSKAVKKTAKTAPKKAPQKSNQPALKVHWLQDLSLEIPFPATAAFAPGQRELDFSAGVQHFTLPDGKESKIELRLRVYIHAQTTPLALAEMCYSGVVDKTHFATNEKKTLEELYQQARPRLLEVLAGSGHQPPLPDKLNQ